MRKENRLYCKTIKKLFMAMLFSELPRSTGSVWIYILNRSSPVYICSVKRPYLSFPSPHLILAFISSFIFQSFYLCNCTSLALLFESLQVLLCFLVAGFCIVRNSPTLLAFHFSGPLKQKMNTSQLLCSSAWCCEL